MSKESVYDDLISPLMSQIIEICKGNGIAAFATFALDGDLECTTCLPDETGTFPDDIQECVRIVYRKPEFFAFTITEKGKT